MASFTVPIGEDQALDAVVSPLICPPVSSAVFSKSPPTALKHSAALLASVTARLRSALSWLMTSERTNRPTQMAAHREKETTGTTFLFWEIAVLEVAS